MRDITMDYINIINEETQKHYKEILEVNGYYFWQHIRGGISVIINEDGKMLWYEIVDAYDKFPKRR